MNIISYLGRGIMHEKNNLPCQDSLTYISASKTKSNNTILAVSDGCSSSKFSKEAADIATKTISDIFSNYSIEDILFASKLDSWDSIKAHLLEQINDAIVQKATDMKKEAYLPNDFCCTLLFVIIGEKNALVGHIGDGLVYIADKNLNPIFVSDAENGIDSTHTYFTFMNSINSFQLTLIPSVNIEYAFLSSDGPYKTLLACDKDDVGIPVRAIFEQMNYDESKICNRNTLALFMEDITHSVFRERSDDWSIILYNKSQEQCDDEAPVPISMRVEMFYAKEAKKNNELADKLPRLVLEDEYFNKLLEEAQGKNTQKDTPKVALEEAQKELSQDIKPSKDTLKNSTKTDEATQVENEPEETQEEENDTPKPKKKVDGIAIVLIVLLIFTIACGVFGYLNRDAIIKYFDPYKETCISVNDSIETTYTFDKDKYTFTNGEKNTSGTFEKDENILTLKDRTNTSTTLMIQDKYLYNPDIRFNEPFDTKSKKKSIVLNMIIQLEDNGFKKPYNVCQKFSNDGKVEITVSEAYKNTIIYQNNGTYKISGNSLTTNFDVNGIKTNPYTKSVKANCTYLIIDGTVYSEIYKTI